jgi:hypothetical protein
VKPALRIAGILGFGVAALDAGAFCVHYAFTPSGAQVSGLIARALQNENYGTKPVL